MIMRKKTTPIIPLQQPTTESVKQSRHIRRRIRLQRRRLWEIKSKTCKERGEAKKTEKRAAMRARRGNNLHWSKLLSISLDLFCDYLERRFSLIGYEAGPTKGLWTIIKDSFIEPSGTLWWPLDCVNNPEDRRLSWDIEHNLDYAKIRFLSLVHSRPTKFCLFLTFFFRLPYLK